MRGTPSKAMLKSVGTRIIPADAGNTHFGDPAGRVHRDHPRGCGEHVVWTCPSSMVTGSSPRMRGTLQPLRSRNLCVGGGVIPADAGNTNWRQAAMWQYTDHPRGCGEHDSLGEVVMPGAGSSPRMRGTRFSCTQPKTGARIIPADAGNTSSARERGPLWEDHPRGCGEHRRGRTHHIYRHGSSPRMRGTPQPGGCQRDAAGIIPADAGNTRHSSVFRYSHEDHPRGCGEHSITCW